MTIIFRMEWLKNLLKYNFFDPCNDHHNKRKNEKNIFCIDCGVGFCKHCVDCSSSIHRLHQWFQICKYVYHDVVRLHDIQKYLDCSQIQTYKINGEKAVHLKPRPQLRDTTKVTKGGAFCESCGRHIQDWPNNYCSISCKVSSSRLQQVGNIPNSELNNDLCSVDNKCEAAAATTTTEERNSKENNECCSSTSESTSGSLQELCFTANLNLSKRLRKRKGVPTRSPLL